MEQLELLEGLSEEQLDRFTRMAAHIFDAPMALISLIGADHQQVGACIGMDLSVANQGLPFSAQAMLAKDPLIVEDATQDARFADHPLVAGAPHVRFYAGMAIRTTDGIALGALGVMAPEARTPASGAIDRLNDLAVMVGDALELQRQMRDRAEAEARVARQRDQWHRFIDHHPDPVLISSDQTVIRYANAAAAETFGADAPEALCGRTVYDLVAPEYHDAIEVRTHRTKGQSLDGLEHEFIRTDGERRRGVSYSNLVDWEGEEAALTVVRDVTQQRTLQRQLQYRAELEHLIARLSARFLNTSPVDLDDEIEAALGALGAFIGVDRSYIFRVRGTGPMDTRTMDNTHEWCAPGIAPQQANLQDLPCSMLPWWMEHMARLEPIEIPDVAALPPEAAAEKDILEAQDITSLLVVPIASDEELVGFIGFDIVDATVELYPGITTVLQVVGDLFASAFRQRRTERARHASEARFQNLLQSLDDVVWSFELDDDAPYDLSKSQLRYNNEATERVYGYPQADFFENQDLWFEVIHPEDQAQVQRHMEALFETGAVDYEHRIVTPDGDVRWLRSSVRLQYDDAGQPTGMGGIATDITARKTMEEEVRATTSRLATIVQHLNGGLVYENENREILFVNQQFCTLFDIDAPAEALVGTDCSAGTQAAAALMRDPDAFIAAIETRIANKEPVSADVVERKDGRIYERDFIPVFSDGTYRGHLWHYRDVTKHRQAQRKLRESERKYRTLFDASNDAIFIHNMDGVIQDVNAETSALFGFSREELIGKPIHELHPPSALDTARNALEEIDEKGSVRFQILCARRDGSQFWGEISASLLQLDGKVAIQGLIRDITAQKETAEYLRQALEKERELGELKSRFVSMASHELRTPLTTIQSSAELTDLFLKKRPEKARSHLTRIQENVTKMTELLEDVLLFGRAESGGLPFHPEPIPLDALVEDLLRDVRQGIGTAHTIAARGIDTLGTIQADAQLVRLVLSNLLSNALKYSDAGTTVDVACKRTDEAVQFTIADEGIGIPASDQERLFEPFHRAENVGAVRGTGLGLSIVNEAVSRHGGSVSVQSAPGEGSTFTVSLPFSPPHEAVAAELA